MAKEQDTESKDKKLLLIETDGTNVKMTITGINELEAEMMLRKCLSRFGGKQHASD